MVAGANGAGKSTYSERLREAGLIVVDPDAIAREYGLGSIAAGRNAIAHAYDFLARQQTFAIETTLAGHGWERLVDTALAEDYRVSLVFIGTNEVEINIDRIRGRVALGGHDVDEVDVRRRFARGLANLPRAIESVHDVLLVDNSTMFGHTSVAISQGADLLALADAPRWVRELAPGIAASLLRVDRPRRRVRPS